jgi:UDP-glucuronate decarboxylase
MISTDPVIQKDVKKYLESGGLPFGNCAILGANGMLSSYLLDFISTVNASHGEPSRVFGFSRRASVYTKILENRKNIKMFHISELKFLLELENVHVIHTASPSSLAELRKDNQALIESNLRLTTAAHSYLEKTGGRLTYFSSGEVYGHSAKIPTSESDYSPYDHLKIDGYYAEVKRFTEMINQIWSERTSHPVTILRIFHTFGPGIRRSDNRIFASAIFGMLDFNRIQLNSNGLATRSFMYTADLASAISATSKLDGFHVFNVGGQKEMTIREFAELISKFSQNCEVSTSSSLGDSILSNNKIARGLANTEKLKSLGWIPKVTIPEAIALTIESNKWREENQIL